MSSGSETYFFFNLTFNNIATRSKTRAALSAAIVAVTEGLTPNLVRLVGTSAVVLSDQYL